MEDRLVIKTGKEPFAISCMIGTIVLLIWIWIEGSMRENPADYRAPGMIENIVVMLLVAAWIYIMFIFGIMMSAKKMELTKNGCTISILFRKKFYPWEEYQVKRLERFHKNKLGGKHMVIYDEGVVFSRKPLKVIGMKKYWEVRFAWRHKAFSTVWFCFQTEESRKKGMERYIVYDIDKNLFFRKMEEWGIELDPEVDEWVG